MGDFFSSGSEQKGTTPTRWAEHLLAEAFMPGSMTGSHRGGGEREGVSGMMYDYFSGTGQDYVSSLARPGATVPIRYNDGSVGSTKSPSTPLSGLSMAQGGVQQPMGDAAGLLASIQGRDPVLLRNQSHVNKFGFNSPQTIEGLQAMVNQGQGQGGTSGGTTLLPSVGEIGQFNTVFQKYDMGMLGDSADAVFNRAFQAINQPIALDTSFMSNVMSQAGSVENLPDPPSLGEATTRVYEDMPQEFQEFTQNILSGASEQSIMNEVDNVAQALTQQAAADADSLGGQLMSVFASQGVTGGAAMAGMQKIAVETATRTNAQIAQTRLAALDTMLKTRDQAIQTMQSLLAAGQADQAAIVNTRIANLEAQTAIQTAKIQASVQIQNSLINAQVALQGQQFGLIGDMFNTVAQQSSAQEAARIEANKLPYDVLLALATGGGNYQKEKTGAGASILGGIAGGVGSFLGTKYGV